MDIQYTCRAVKYDPGEELKTNLTLIFDFQVDVQVLNGFIYRLIDATFFLPMEPIDYIETNVGRFDHYTCGFRKKAHIQVIDKNNFIIHFQRNSIPGFLTERNLFELGITDLREVLKEDIVIAALFMNLQFSRDNSEEAGAIYVASILKGRD